MIQSTDINASHLRRWMARHVPALGEIRDIAKFAGGQSNPTYRLIGSSGEAVLRRKPFGPLLPSAHAIEREYRLLSALSPLGFPVPQPLALCEDPDIIGANFYVMSLVAGRNFPDGLLPAVSRDDRAGLYQAMITTLAQLHAIDVDAAGLGDFGPRGQYFERQIARWSRQYRATQTDLLPEVEQLMAWLPTSVPVQTRATIIHGDYRIDNLIFAARSSQVVAVLDWELATIGDPLADFAYFMMNWIMPPLGAFGIVTPTLSDSGIPSLDEAIELYRLSVGIDAVPALHWYFAFNLFRLTGISQGVKRRMLDGNASSANADAAAALVPAFAALAWQQAMLAGA